MEKMEKIVVQASEYDLVDGRNAGHSRVKKLTLGAPRLPENQQMEVAAQLWRENEEGELELAAELAIHQVFDLMLLLSRTLLYFKDAYRMPLLYDPENPLVERIGVQGGALPVEICPDNPAIQQDIQQFSQSLSNLGELTGERLRRLTAILDELKLY